MHEDTTLSQYEIQCRVGTGAFSQVYRGVHLLTNSEVAIKIIDFEKLENDDKIGTIREVATLLQLDHPNIVSLFNYAFYNDKLYIFLEFIPHGTLLDKVNHLRGLSEDQARRYFKDIISAIFYLHHVRGIVHRDLKLQNMILTSDDHIKLIDFGFCNSMMKSNIFHTFVGTPGFTAPEVIQNTNGYSESCDIFSLGICLFSMVAGKRPFDLQNKDKKRLIDQIESLETNPQFINVFSKDLQFLLKGMLNPDPSQRMTLDQIMTSDWLQSDTRPVLSLKTMIDLRRFTTKESLQIASRKSLLKPNYSAVNALRKFGYAPEKVITELRRGRVTDGTAAYLMMMCTMSTEELDDTSFQKPKKTTTTPSITIPTSICSRKQQRTPHKIKNDTKFTRIPKSYRSRLTPI
ncbi:AGC family protein kinase [Tritrichomonas foetus]|uniref:AGC family protein kinase n=1 Tax=Tritrichomonas foetus TaxID=1144522 RepID=A0A1J4KMT9_9EUKA|nr:AGC family protein kinase [Tritrichomonas foetus]|eukprot:OHT10701.1 AGC family protein kinase [Tritrichomonas foetus]